MHLPMGNSNAGGKNDQLSLLTLFVLGVFLSVIGAAVVQYLRIPQFRHSSVGGEIIHGGLVGVLFGFAGGGVGWVIAETSLWALLIWFGLGAVLVCAARTSFTKRVTGAG
jgi:hypothetical protein